MPSLPSRSSRRRRTTPIAKRSQHDVWQRTLDLMGVEPLRKTKTKTDTRIQESSLEMAETTVATVATAACHLNEKEKKKKKKLSLLDLPLETQKGIFSFSSSTDLVSLALVSRHFRNIASEHLYRSFYIVFPDDDDPANESSIDGLAGGLETFVSSDYNYASYLKEIILETLGPTGKEDRAYRHYLYDASCGKFMNTLFLLTLRKAKSLETFTWDIRVELSRQVFKTLHDIQTLQNLHLRMQLGPSVYEPPPALPNTLHSSVSFNPTPLPPVFHHPIYIPPAGPPQPLGPSLGGPPGPPPGNPYSSSYQVASKLSSKPPHKSAKDLLSAPFPAPPTLSRFKNLKSLSILDMDSHEYVGELRQCIQNSSSTLTSLKLSFSETLANKSRKPPPDPPSDDESDQEDEFGQLLPPGPPPPVGASDPNGPIKILKAAEERKKQEAVLGKIFGVDNIIVKPRPAPAVKPPPQLHEEDDPKKRFIRDLASVAARLMAHIKPGGDATAEGKETLAMIERAAQLYMSSEVKESAEDSITKPTPASSRASIDGVTEENSSMSGATPVPEPGLFDKKQDTKKKEPSVDPGISNPDDIDIEEPEFEDIGADETPADDLPEDNDISDSTNTEPESAHVDVKDEVIEGLNDNVNKTTQASLSSPTSDTQSLATRLQVLTQAIAIRTSHSEIQKDGEQLKAKMESFRLKLQNGSLNPTDTAALFAAEREFRHVAVRIEELSRQMQDIYDQMDGLNTQDVNCESIDKSREETEAMSEYIRETRGLTLHSLSISLIPIRASVLSRAIDLSVLQSIVLLNVGPQIPFWNLLARENKIDTLRLRKIHTDNVTLPFIAFVSQLTALDELYLLERAAKPRVETTSAKTTVTIEQIRKLVLKKHASTLKNLVIRNDSNLEWDMNVKTALLLCSKAKMLEELAVSFGVRTMHALLQHIPGLSSLRVLHTISIRNNDSCQWAMSEFRKFVVDIISSHPDMKLEYLALDNSVERLVRRKPKPVARKKYPDLKGKGKQIDSQSLAELVMGPGSIWPDGSGNDSPTSSGSTTTYTTTSGFQSDLLNSSGDEDGNVTYYSKTGLKIETVEGIRFYDILSVKIFDKEILDARL